MSVTDDDRVLVPGHGLGADVNDVEAIQAFRMGWANASQPLEQLVQVSTCMVEVRVYPGHHRVLVWPAKGRIVSVKCAGLQSAGTDDLARVREHAKTWEALVGAMNMVERVLAAMGVA